MAARVRLHVPVHMLAGDGVPKFYRRLLAELEACGAATEVLPRDQVRLRRGPDAGHFDLVHNGGVARAQVLNMAPAYLGGFWYADPQGIYFESAIHDMAFRPKGVPADRAAAFTARLRRSWVEARKSRHPQPEAAEAFGTGHIAVFLQDWSDPVDRARFMPATEMVRAVVAGRAGRDVVIKPHPRNMGAETVEILHAVRRTPQVRVSRGNIHDILAGAAVSVSISSSVALEGMLHGVPALLFGRSDLRNCAVTVERAADWPQALDAALSRRWPFEAFLYWFLARQNLDASRPVLPRLLNRMAAQGADFAALGIDPAAVPGEAGT